MKDKLYEEVEDLVKDLEKEFGEVDVRDIEKYKEVVGECGVMLWIDSDLGYESGVFGVNGDGEMFGFSGNNDEIKEFRFDENEIVSLWCNVMDR